MKETTELTGKKISVFSVVKFFPEPTYLLRREMMKSVKETNRREVIKKIFFSFIVTLPIFNVIFKVFRGKRDERKPTTRELFKSHNLAG